MAAFDFDNYEHTVRLYHENPWLRELLSGTEPEGAPKERQAKWGLGASREGFQRRRPSLLGVDARESS